MPQTRQTYRKGPNPSYGSTYLGRKNYNGGPPLSQYRDGSRTRSSQQQQKPRLREPEVDDAPPMSSSSEEEEPAAPEESPYKSPKPKKRPAQKVEEKNGTTRGRPKRRRGTRSRGDNGDDDQDGQSQPEQPSGRELREQKEMLLWDQKPKVRTGYGSRNAIRRQQQYASRFGAEYGSGKENHDTTQGNSQGKRKTDKGENSKPNGENETNSTPKSSSRASASPKSDKKTRKSSGPGEMASIMQKITDAGPSDDEYTSRSFTRSAQLGAGDDDDDALSDLSDPRSDISDVLIEDSEHQSSITCPICSKPVPEDLQLECEWVMREPFRQQTDFCHKHTQKQGKDEWDQRSYPTIRWDSLYDRIVACFPELEAIITGKKPSYYRKLLTAQAKEEKNKSTMKKFRLTADSKGMEKMSTGYYGPRGAKVMMDTVISHFARKMRRLAPSDTLIKDASVAGFVQAVLVPELTVMFVKEDMHVDDEEARRIIEESKGIGELLNEQPNDTVGTGI